MNNEIELNGPVIFLLGAADPEMVLIESMLRRVGVYYQYAMVNGKRVHPGNAYEATEFGNLNSASTMSLEGLRVVTVECGIEGVSPDYHIDHHRPGDRGYGLTPDQFFEGSSIGQTYFYLCEELGISSGVYRDRLWEYRLAAAADHCLGHAYQGECPGIDPTALRLWRAITRAEFQGTSPRTILERAGEAQRKIADLPVVRLGSFHYRDAGFQRIDELPEAAAMFQQPVQYKMQDRTGRTKVGLIGAKSGLIKKWMESQEGKLVGIYGDPERGYAGGYEE